MIGVLLAGFAGIGDQDHQSAMYLPAWRAQAGARIVAVVPSGAGDLATAQKVAAELGVPCRDHLDAALADDSVDLVSVAVPLAQRADVVTAAVRAGKHVLADKPLAATLDEVEAIATVLAAHPRVLVPALPHRLASPVLSARAALASGRVGLPWNVQADFLVAGGSLAPTGELLNLAVHPVDVLHALLGLDALRVHVRRGNYWHGAPDAPEDFVALLIDYDNGVTGTVVTGRTGELDGVAPGALIRHRYRISGSHGVLDVDAGKPALTVRTASVASSPWVGAGPVAALVDATCRAVTSGAKPPVGLDDARHVHRVLDAAYRSLGSGRPEGVTT
ncbi:MAG TPA: Gfo/Idh/MocA family oxidoreductase [Jatrophihabitantaceae bacterium]|nr:Gfo/Idh/MocA family oxidoreductase [Jatrophihabitantaceae bacterium]